MFNKIVIENIRSIIRTEFPLKKMNIFIGANSSGKSSILASLLALQSLAIGRTSLPKPFEDLRSICRRGANGVMSVELIELEEKNRQTKLEVYFTEMCNMWYNLKTTSSNEKQLEELTLSGPPGGISSDTLDDALYERLPDSQKAKMRIALKKSHQGFSYLIDAEDRDITHASGSLDLLNFDFTPISRQYSQIEEHFLKQRVSFFNNLSEIVYISVQRGFFESAYALQDELRKKLTSDTVSAEEIFNIQTYRDYRDPEATKNMAHWAKEFGIHGFETEVQPGRRIEGRGYIKAIESKEHLPVSLFGFGSNQFLTVIAKCVFAPKDVPILIEEPEIHLHPEMQALATDFLIEQMKDGHQLFITTHSENMIGRIQRRLAEKVITPEEVGIYWVKYDLEKGTTVDEVEMNEDGVLHTALRTYMDFLQEEISATRAARSKATHGKEGA